jgi:hypothetical protein
MDVTLSDTRTPSARAEGGSRRSAAVVLAGLSLVFVVSVFYKPPETDYIPICIFKALTGLPCPGCGLTHSFCALAKGKLASAFGYNAVGPPIFLLAIGFWLRSAALLVGKLKAVRVFDRIARGRTLTTLLLLVLGAFGIGRIVYILAFHPQMVGKASLLRVIIGLVVGT